SLRDGLRAIRQGDFAVRLPSDGTADGLLSEITLAFNALAEQNTALVSEIDRVARKVGFEGNIDDRASLGPATGSWAVAVSPVNSLIESMAFPTVEATRVLGSVVDGDLSRDMPLHSDGHALRGTFSELGMAVNLVLRRLRSVSTGVSRIVREIGTEGK